MGKKKTLVPKTLKFIEQYIDEAPPKDDGPRRWRGITAYVGEDDWSWVIRMSFIPKKNRFDEEDHFEFDTCLGMTGDPIREKFRGVSKHTKEGAMPYAQEVFNEYVMSLCDEK